MTFEIFAARFLLNDFTGICRKHGAEPHTSRLPAKVLGPVLRLAHAGIISRHDLRGFCAEILS